MLQRKDAERNDVPGGPLYTQKGVMQRAQGTESCPHTCPSLEETPRLVPEQPQLIRKTTLTPCGH